LPPTSNPIAVPSPLWYSPGTSIGEATGREGTPTGRQTPRGAACHPDDYRTPIIRMLNRRPSRRDRQIDDAGSVRVGVKASPAAPAHAQRTRTRPILPDRASGVRYRIGAAEMA
jgi:hypothetical protein